jgi:glutamyl-tRNA synthetase
MGIVPEAFRNFLGLLGWTPGVAGKEILSSGELIELFSLGGISKSNAVFDNDKLAWFNTEWIRRYSPQDLLPLIEEEWARAGFHSDRTGEEILATIALLQPRARSLKDFAGAFRGYFSDAYEYDTAAVAKFLPDEQSRGLLMELGERYELVDAFTEAGAEELLRTFAAEKGVKAGALINGSRVALTGQGVAPSLFAVMAALGKERVTKRLKVAGSIPSAHEESRVG